MADVVEVQFPVKIGNEWAYRGPDHLYTQYFPTREGAVRHWTKCVVFSTLARDFPQLGSDMIWRIVDEEVR